MFDKFFFNVDRGFGRTLIACALMGMAVTGAARAEGDPEAGQAKSLVCAACHGADGNSVNPEWPSLAGQHANYSVRQLQAYQNGLRNNVLMLGQVAGLSEQDMKDLSAFYETQTKNPLPAGDGDLELGERIYRGGNAETGVSACIACHGPRGLGNPLEDYPRVGSQHARYLADTLRDYRSGARQSDEDMNQMMRSIARRMTDEEIDAVAAYMQGLQ
ncbi:MAG: cytochrome c4 [Gammaproteobacteria bacterium]|nr:cytochrome c4 [Gammaproteobacteria bacterium]TVQ47909.1 MAG: cytochrome c4 [Gammaproteobacteria bacterium]